MKKKLFCILTFILIVMAFIFGYFYFALNNQTEDNYNVNTEQFYQLSPDKVITKLVNKEKGLYYFGFSTCPWCIELVPIFNEVLKEKNSKSYVVNTKSEELDSEDYNKLEEFYQNYYSDDLTVPFVVSINSSGDVLTNVGTIEGHDATARKMTTGEAKKLRKKLTSMVDWAK